MAGRKPLPTNVKLAMGNPGKRPMNPHEPKVAPSKLRVPACLKADKVAAKAYKDFGKQLVAAGVMTALDETSLTMLCMEYSRWLKAEETLRKEGETLKTDKGYVYQHPALGIATKAKETMMRILTEFGMTPSARSRIKAMPQGQAGGKGLAERLIPTLEASEIAKQAEEWTPPVGVTG